MKSNLYKGSLSTIILHLLAEKREMYGYEMSKLVKEKSDDKLLMTEGALYPILHKLEADGIITSDTRYVDNRNRKYYKITEKGAKQHVLSLKEMKDYLQTMQNMLLPTLPTQNALV